MTSTTLSLDKVYGYVEKCLEKYISRIIPYQTSTKKCFVESDILLVKKIIFHRFIIATT